MYQSQLLDAYKKAQNYIQDKQIAMDLNLPNQRISEMRKGVRYISDEEAIFLAEQAGIPPELALLGCHADRHENPKIKQLWEHIAKKYNGLGLQGLSMACGALVLGLHAHVQDGLQCVLYRIMYDRKLLIDTKVNYKKPLIFRGFFNVLSSND